MQLALSELMRAKLRFGLLAGAVGLLVFLLLFLNTLSQTLLRFFVGGIESNSAQVLVYDGAARQNLQASRLDPAALSQVRGVDGVGDAAPIGQTTVAADAGRGLTDVTLWGFVPGRPGQPGKVIEGQMPGPGEALVDKADSENGFAVGAEIELKPTGRRVRIVGYTQDSKFAVLPTAYVTLDEYESIFRELNPMTPYVPLSAIGVDAVRGVAPTELADRINAAVPGVDALERKQAAAAVPGVESISQSFSLIVGITFIIVVLVIGFFFLILTVQKLRIFMALLAVGASVGRLAKSLLIQIAIVVGMGLIGALLLLLLATATSSESFPLKIEPTLVLEATSAVLVFSLLSALVSVRRINRLDPAEAAQVR